MHMDIMKEVNALTNVSAPGKHVADIESMLRALRSTKNQADKVFTFARLLRAYSENKQAEMLRSVRAVVAGGIPDPNPTAPEKAQSARTAPQPAAARTAPQPAAATKG